MDLSRQALKRAAAALLGLKAYGALVSIYGRAVVAPRTLATTWGRHSASLLRSWEDRNRGGRCVILGNGPSLRATDWTLLEDEFTFGLNRIYLAFDDMGFRTDVLVCVNDLVLEQFGHEILALPTPKFLGWRASQVATPRRDVVLLQSVPGPQFSKDLLWNGVWEGATVTFVALQLAYWMGFTDVVLIGVDHRFASRGTPHEEVTSRGPDSNHFDPRYFGRGVRWQLPDLETSEVAYRLAKEVYETDGRRIVDATDGGALTVFPKTDLETALSGGR